MRNTGIRKFSALLLLAAFVLCNTPTHVLHTLFANHKDNTAETDAHHPFPQVAATGIDCHCISNVTTAPYLPAYTEWTTVLPLQYFQYEPDLAGELFTVSAFHPTLRGPPELE